MSANNELLPSKISNTPWLYEESNHPRLYEESKFLDYFSDDTGKWMLFYDKKTLDDAWSLAKTLYREDKLKGVVSMKCSTNYKNSRASTQNDGVIILYCNNSSDEDTIMDIGKNILNTFKYTEKQTIFYKTASQTSEGTRATGCKTNSTYKLFNHLHNNSCNLDFLNNLEFN